MGQVLCASSVPPLPWVLRLVSPPFFLIIIFFCFLVSVLLFFVGFGINGVFSLPPPPPQPRPGCPLCPVPSPPPPPHGCLLVPRLEPDILLRAKQDFLKIDSAADLQ